MRKVVQTENYSGLKGELIKLTGKDIITAATNKFNEIIDWNYQMLINGKVECLMNGHLTDVKKRFQNRYSKESYLRIWKYEK